MRWLERLILGAPWVPIVLVAAVTAWLGWRLQDFTVDASSDSLILEGDPDLRVYDETRLLFTSDEYVIVACHLDAAHAQGRAEHPDDPFAPAGVAVMADVTERLGAIAGVRDVQSCTTVPLLRSAPGGVNIAGLIQATERTYLTSPGVDLERARAELVGHAMIGQNLVSADGHTVAWVVVFDKDPRLDEVERRVRDVDRRLLPFRDDPDTAPRKAALLAERAGLMPEFTRLETARKADRRRIVGETRARLAVVTAERGVAFFLSGIPIIIIDMVTFIEQDMVAFGVGAAAFLGLVLLVIFRRWRWTVLPVLTCGVVVVWILGLLVVLDKKTTVVTSNLSSLLFIVGMAHSLHFIVKYREVAAAHPDWVQRRRVGATLGGIIAPCLFTALTTMVGFASLAISRIRPVVDFGNFMSLGVGLAFVTSFLFFPAALCLLAPSTDGHAGHGARVPWLGRLGAGALRFGPAIGVFALGLFVAAAWGATKIEVETKFIDYFKTSSPLYRGLDFIDNNLGGTTTLEIVLQAPMGHDFLEPEPYAKLAALQAHMEDPAVFPEMGKILSPVSLGEELEKLAAAANPMMVAMFLGVNPKTTAPIELQRLALQKLLGIPAMRQQVEPLLKEVATPDLHAVRLFMRAKETSPNLKRNVTLAKIRSYLERTMPEYELPPPRHVVVEQLGGVVPRRTGLRADVTGVFVLYTNMLNSLILSQVTSFWVVFAGIWGMIAFFFHVRLWRRRGWSPWGQPILFAVFTAVVLAPMGLCAATGHLLPGGGNDAAVGGPPVVLIGAGVVQLCVLLAPVVLGRVAPAAVARWDASEGLVGGLFLTWRVLLLALLAMLPNILPVAVVLGLMGWTGIRLDLATIMVASVSLGIAVDDTIHYIYRYHEEREQGGDDHAIVVRAHETIGQAIIYTSVAVIGGFWVLLLSNFKPTIYFGLFTGAAMLAAVFGTLTLLPLLLVWCRPLPPSRGVPDGA